MAVDCIEHTGCRNKKGYGKTTSMGRGVLTHRLAYAQHHGISVFDIVGVVMHTCDNPPCKNPAHLVLGSSADNSADMVAKGRQAIKFPDAVVAEVRSRYVPPTPGTKNGTTGNATALCAEFGMSKMQLSKLIRNKVRTTS